jgi:DNA-directed RNA polymerase specialized sigma24 family protein
MAPSNRFLAQVLGMCRGTVDSTLASARKHEYSRVS